MVYAVQAPGIPGLRALKLLLRAADPDSQIRFRREAELLASVRHPGVVAIHEVGEDPAGMFLVMDLVEGEPLDEVLRRGPVDPDLARRWILEVADAVAALHAKRILHRDLKPANLMLRPDGHVLLLDFGLARAAGRTALTQTGSITGSPGYMAPEQADGQNVMTPAVDVHGLGAVLFAFLTGQAPYRGGTVLEGLRSVLEDEVQWPASVPGDLVAAGRSALLKDPVARHRDAAAFGQALRSAPPPRRTRRGLWVVAAALVLAGVAVTAAWFAVAQTDPSPTPAPTLATPTETEIPATSEAPPPTVDLRNPPGTKDAVARALWYRAAWRATRGKTLARAEKKTLRDVREKRLLAVPTRASGTPSARFWGPSLWVRPLNEKIEWGEWSREGKRRSQPLHAPILAREGDSLWALEPGTWKVWRSTRPDDPLELVDLRGLAAKSGAPTQFAVHGASLGLASLKTVWEIDLSAAPPRAKSFAQPKLDKVVGLLYTSNGVLLTRSKRGNRSRVSLARSPSTGVTLTRAKCVAVDPQSDLVIAGDNSGVLSAWRASDPAPVAKPLASVLDTRQIDFRGLAFSPSGDWLYSVSTPASALAKSAGEFSAWRRGEEGWREVRRQRLRYVPLFLDVSADGAWVLISGATGQTELWAAGGDSPPR